MKELNLLKKIKILLSAKIEKDDVKLTFIDKLYQAHNFLVEYNYLPNDSTITFTDGSYISLWLTSNKEILEMLAKLKNVCAIDLLQALSKTKIIEVPVEEKYKGLQNVISTNSGSVPTTINNKEKQDEKFEKRLQESYRFLILNKYLPSLQSKKTFSDGTTNMGIWLYLNRNLIKLKALTGNIIANTIFETQQLSTNQPMVRERN